MDNTQPFGFDKYMGAQADAQRCLSNIRLARKAVVLQAIAESGNQVEWRDVPDERLTYERDMFGSVWSIPGIDDCSDFWAALRRLEGQP